MILLFDQNISFRLINNLRDIFPDANQVRELGLENRSDIDIWNFAKERSTCIVTFDADFNDLSILYGHPPKVIWLRSQNQSTANIEKLLRVMYDEIIEFLDQTYPFGCLEIIDYH